MNDDNKLKIFAIVVLVALLGGSWITVKHGKNIKDYDMWSRYYH